MTRTSQVARLIVLGICMQYAWCQTAGAQSLLGATKRTTKASAGSTQSSRKSPAAARPRQKTAGASKPVQPRGAVPAKASAARPNALQATLLESVAIQAALDQSGFSPGIIDGVPGRKTQTAIRAFQASATLPQTGKIDDLTRKALGLDSREALRAYLITEADAALVAPPPKTWPQKAKVSLLGYTSLAGLVAERGHCTTALLGRLNAGVKLDALRVGQTVQVPNVEPVRTSDAAKATVVEIDLDSKIIRALDASGRAIGLYHCSIAADRRKRPSGTCTIENIVENPRYTFDPANWPEVKDVKQRLIIPPGPRNPVGLCWIGLSIKGYGIHGTPEPENIGRTGSHGCFRLTNWDAQRLAGQVRVGAEVRFTDTPGQLATSVID